MSDLNKFVPIAMELNRTITQRSEEFANLLFDSLIQLGLPINQEEVKTLLTNQYNPVNVDGGLHIYSRECTWLNKPKELDDNLISSFRMYISYNRTSGDNEYRRDNISCWFHHYTEPKIIKPTWGTSTYSLPTRVSLSSRSVNEEFHSLAEFVAAYNEHVAEVTKDYIKYTTWLARPELAKKVAQLTKDYKRAMKAKQNDAAKVAATYLR